MEASFSIYLKALGYAISTQKQIKKQVHDFIEYQKVKRRNMLYITSVEILQYHNYLQTKPNKTKGGYLSESMIACHLFALKVFFHYLHISEYVSHNPISSLRFKNAVIYRRESISQESITRLYKACTNLRDRAILSLFYGCGMRRMEVISLDVSDVLLEEKVVIVQHGKGNKRRVIPLSGQVKEDLQKYYQYDRKQQATTDASFILTRNKQRMGATGYVYFLKQLVKRAELEETVCLHQLRHSIATHLLEQGMNIERVRIFLGHSNLSTTQRYTHVKKILVKNEIVHLSSS